MASRSESSDTDSPDDVSVAIDDGGQLRVLRPEAREGSASLVEESRLLVSKVRELQTIMEYIHKTRREDEELRSKIEAKEKEAEEFAAYLTSLKIAEKKQRAEIANLKGR